MHLEELTAELIQFAFEELGVDEAALRSTDREEDLRQKLLDDLLWIEVEEIENSPADAYSDRGKKASLLINILCYPMPDPDDE